MRGRDLADNRKSRSAPQGTNAGVAHCGATGRSCWRLTATLAGLLALLPPAALAHGETHATTAGSAAGEPGVVAQATRTVTVTSTDGMRFEPDNLRFARGDVVRLRIVNAGTLPHEFVLGTAAEIEEHAAMMRQMPGMHHAEANAVQIAPGATQEIIWRFTRKGRFAYACLVPGHFEAGMRGNVVVVDVAKRSRR